MDVDRIGENVLGLSWLCTSRSGAARHHHPGAYTRRQRLVILNER